MKFGLDEMARHCLEAVRPEFAAQVRPGDVMVGRRQLRHRLVARAGRRRCWCSWAWRRWSRRRSRACTCATRSTSACCCSPARRPNALRDGERIAFDARAGLVVREDGETLRLRSHPRIPAGHGAGRRPARAIETSQPQGGNMTATHIRPADQERPCRAAAWQRRARADIAIAGGKVARVAPGIDATLAKSVTTARAGSPFPAWSTRTCTAASTRRWPKTRSARAAPRRMGGVTSSLNYFRTGQYYLNKGGPYRKFFPEVLKTLEGTLPRRLRLPPGADGRDAHRRDPRADPQARRGQLQDLHVLRLARPARRARTRSAIS